MLPMNTLLVDGILVDEDKAIDAVRRCVTCVMMIEDYYRKCRMLRMEPDQRQLFDDLLKTLKGEDTA